MIKTILVATDGSNHAKKAVSLASEIAKLYEARLVVLHAQLRDETPETIRKLVRVRALSPTERKLFDRYEFKPKMAALAGGYAGVYLAPPPPQALLEAVGRQILDGAKAVANKMGVKKVSTVMASGDVADGILDWAKRADADLIVLGTRGFGELRALVLGSVSHKVSARAPCACLTVK